MNRRWWRICSLIFTMETLILCMAGCRFHSTRQGWTMSQPDWSLEFKRSPSCNAATQSAESSNGENSKVQEGRNSEDGEEAVLYRADPRLLERYNNSPFARLMERRGRLGICACCGRLGRFEGTDSIERPPQQVIARLFPVPTQPVFSPRDETMQSVCYEPDVRKKKQEPAEQKNKSQPKAPMPEEIPAPPVASAPDKSAAAAPRQLDQLDLQRETSTWIFTKPPETKPDPVIEPYIPPRDPDLTARRR
jgi:hypothetical protein